MIGRGLIHLFLSQVLVGAFRGIGIDPGVERVGRRETVRVLYGGVHREDDTAGGGTGNPGERAGRSAGRGGNNVGGERERWGRARPCWCGGRREKGSVGQIADTSQNLSCLP